MRSVLIHFFYPIYVNNIYIIIIDLNTSHNTNQLNLWFFYHLKASLGGGPLPYNLDNQDNRDNDYKLLDTINYWVGICGLGFRVLRPVWGLNWV